MATDLTNDSFEATYTTSEEWLTFMRSLTMPSDAGVWRFQVAAAIALYAMSMVVAGALGALAAAALRAESDLILFTLVLSGVGATLGVRFWANRVCRPYTEVAERAYTVGAEMRYRFDEAGFRMTGDGQDLQFDWRHLMGVETVDEAMILRTPFIRLVLPISALPISVDQAHTRFDHWHKKATSA